MGAEDQLSFILPSPPELIVGVAMNRTTRGFSGRPSASSSSWSAPT